MNAISVEFVWNLKDVNLVIAPQSKYNEILSHNKNVITFMDLSALKS